MTKRIRLAIFITFAFLYFILAPTIILYSLGYRIDLEKKQIVSTGGVYLRVWPSGSKVTVGKNSRTIGLFFNDVTFQGLLPKKYSILVEKDGYHSWGKNLEIKEREVIQVRNITLTKESPVFERLNGKTKYFYLSPDNRSALLIRSGEDKNSFAFEIFDLQSREESTAALLSGKNDDVFGITWSSDSKRILIERKNNNERDYFLAENQGGKIILESLALSQDTDGKKIHPRNVQFNPSDANQIFFIDKNSLYAAGEEGSLLIAEELINYSVFRNEIFWLDDSGFFWKSDLLGSNANKISEKPLPIKDRTPYQIIIQPQFFLIKEENSLFIFDSKKQEFVLFASPVGNIGFSPDGSKFFYHNDYEIFMSFVGQFDFNEPIEKKLLMRFSGKINECFWLNNHYLIFNDNGQIKISEIDTRDRINMVSFPQKIITNGQEYPLSDNLKIVFSESDKKLYILDENNLFVSEPITDRSNR